MLKWGIELESAISHLTFRVVSSGILVGHSCTFYQNRGIAALENSNCKRVCKKNDLKMTKICFKSYINSFLSHN